MNMFCGADFICQICIYYFNYRMIKWVAAFLGYYLFRFPGAIFGFFVGSFLEKLINGSRVNFQTFSQSAEPAQFQLNLIAFAAIVIKADGQVKAQELQFVRNFFITNYGPQKAATIFETFNEQVKKETQNIDELAQVFVSASRYETRLQVIHFLMGVSNADGGCSSYRSLELQEKTSNKLKDKFPEFVTVVKKKTKTGWNNIGERVDVRIRWQKAYKTGSSICNPN